MAFITVQDLPSKEIVAGGEARVIHTGQMSFVYWRVHAGAHFALHQHPHQQVAHVLEGVFELTVGAVTKKLEPGVTAVIEGGVLHGGKAITKIFCMKVCKVFLLFVQPVPVPLRIGKAAVGNNRCISRNGVRAPMNKDAEFIPVKPGRYTTFVERCPVGAEGLCAC